MCHCTGYLGSVGTPTAPSAAAAMLRAQPQQAPFPALDVSSVHGGSPASQVNSPVRDRGGGDERAGQYGGSPSGKQHSRTESEVEHVRSAAITAAGILISTTPSRPGCDGTDPRGT